MAFRIRCELVNDVKGNFKVNYRRRGGEDYLNCEDCSEKTTQTQSHCLVCTRWDAIRTGLDLNTVDGMVEFFKRLLLERSKEKLGSTELHNMTPH